MHNLGKDIEIIRVVQLDKTPRNRYDFMLTCRFKNGFEISKLGNITERDVVNGLLGASVVNVPDRLRLNNYLRPKKQLKVYAYNSDIINFPMVIKEDDRDSFHLIGFCYGTGTP